MRTIYKYPVRITDEQNFLIPFRQVLHAGLDVSGQPCIWCEVDTDDRPQSLTVYVVGTGDPIPRQANDHIGSFVAGPFVWHVYV